jgi:hypothetical protein
LYGRTGGSAGLGSCHHREVIDRAVKLAMATSATTSAVLLVAFNLIPLAGVLFWGWNVATILVLYWVENGIIGVLNVPKILLASGPADPSGDVQALGSTFPSPGGMTSKAALVPFFLIHYGIFWVVHGVFVFTLPLFFAARAEGFDPIAFEAGPLSPGLGTSGPDMSAVAWGAVGLGISRIASFLINYVGRREYLKVSPAQQMFAPYGRLVILHLTILFGAFVSMAIGSPVGAIVVLVMLKIALDLGLHLREHGVLGANRG